MGSRRCKPENLPIQCTRLWSRVQPIAREQCHASSSSYIRQVKASIWDTQNPNVYGPTGQARTCRLKRDCHPGTFLRCGADCAHASIKLLGKDPHEPRHRLQLPKPTCSLQPKSPPQHCQTEQSAEPPKRSAQRHKDSPGLKGTCGYLSAQFTMQDAIEGSVKVGSLL